MRFRRTALALALCAAMGAASAEDLLNVYRDALVSDPVYQAARAQYASSVESLPQARAGYLPNVNASGNYFRNRVDEDIAGKFDYTSKGYAVTLSQPIFRMQNWISIGQAEKVVFQAETTLAGAVQDLIIRVSQAYFDVLLAQDNVALSGAQKVAISEQLAQAKRNFEVGTATIVDTLEAQARYDQADAQEIADKNSLEVKRRALQQLVGKLPEGLAPLRDPLKLSVPQPNDIEAWVTAASDSSVAIVNARAGVDIAKQEINRQRAGYAPTLDLSASYTRTDNPTNIVPGLTGPFTAPWACC